MEIINKYPPDVGGPQGTNIPSFIRKLQRTQEGFQTENLPLLAGSPGLFHLSRFH